MAPRIIGDFEDIGLPAGWTAQKGGVSDVVHDDPSAALRGTRGLLVSDFNGLGCYAYRSCGVADAQAHVWIGFLVKPTGDANGAILMSINNASGDVIADVGQGIDNGVLHLDYYEDGNLLAAIETGGSSIDWTAARWVVVEVLRGNGDGAVRVYVDGVKKLEVLNLHNSTQAATWGNIKLGIIANPGYQVAHFDDVVYSTSAYPTPPPYAPASTSHHRVLRKKRLLEILSMSLKRTSFSQVTTITTDYTDVAGPFVLGGAGMFAVIGFANAGVALADVKILLQAHPDSAWETWLTATDFTDTTNEAVIPPLVAIATLANAASGNIMLSLPPAHAFKIQAKAAATTSVLTVKGTFTTAE
jgi:hypothetical protein